MSFSVCHLKNTDVTSDVSC